MRKVIGFGIILIIAAIVCCPSPILAATLSLTLNGSATQTVNVQAGGEWTSTANWTVTGATDCKEDITASVAATGWTYEQLTQPYGDTASVVNEFILRLNNSTGTIINDGTAHTIIADLGYNATSSAFNFYFKAPPSGTADVQKSMVITLTATNPRGFYNDAVTGHTVAPTNSCTAAGGTIDNSDTSSYYMCKFTGTDVSCPSGWTQYNNWQMYSAAPYGIDNCRGNVASGPTTWQNTLARGVVAGGSGCWSCNGLCYDCTSICYDAVCGADYGRRNSVPSAGSCAVDKWGNNPSNNRLQVGCY